MITIISYNLAADISLSGSSCPLSPGCGVVDRGKSKDLQKNPFGATTTTNNKLNPCICDCRSSNRTPHGWVNYSKLIKGQNSSYFSLKIPGLSHRKLFLSINIAS